MYASRTIRLLDDLPLDGPDNMARDEALLTAVGKGASPPTLRLYQWHPPTISLGYFQHFADFLRLPPPAGTLPVVRRQTGGGAILHDLELTYSLVLPLHHPLLTGGPNRLYERMHDAVIGTLQSRGLSTTRCGVSDDSGAARGPFFCFARRHCFDVLLGADKIAGSAQRRTTRAVLQHGSIVLGNRFDQQPTARAEGEFTATVAAVRALLPESFSVLSECDLARGTWSAEELGLALTLREKYAGDEWTRRM